MRLHGSDSLITGAIFERLYWDENPGAASLLYNFNILVLGLMWD